MAVCDANYIRLLKLLPSLGADYTRDIRLDLPQAVGGEEAASAAAHLVRLQVLESCRYTTTLAISLLSPSTTLSYYRPPVMLVRLYHDADTAEVLRYQEQGGFHLGGESWGKPGFSVDEKQQVNAFLAEWLALCMEQGLGSNPEPVDIVSVD